MIAVVAAAAFAGAVLAVILIARTPMPLWKRWHTASTLSLLIRFKIKLTPFFQEMAILSAAAVTKEKGGEKYYEQGDYSEPWIRRGGRELGWNWQRRWGFLFMTRNWSPWRLMTLILQRKHSRKYDEHVIEDDPLDHKIHHSFSELYKVPMSDQIFVAQSNVIRRLASHGPCGDRRPLCRYDTGGQRKHFHIFKMKQRVKRLMELEPEEGANEKTWKWRSVPLTASAGIITSIIQEIPGEEPRIIIFAWTAA